MNQDSSNLEQIRRICSRFPEATEDRLQDRPLFHVRRRRFAIYNAADAPYRKRWAMCGSSLHLATSKSTFHFLEDDDRFYPSPHHGFRGWVGLDMDGTTDWKEISELLLWAYRHVANRDLVKQLENGNT